MSDIDAAFAERLARLPRLEALDTRPQATTCSAEALEALARAPALRTLRVRLQDAAVPAMSALLAHVPLRELYLDVGALSPEVVRAVARGRTLRRLVLQHHTRRDLAVVDVAPLAALTDLEDLTIMDVRLENVGELAQLPRLRVLRSSHGAELPGVHATARQRQRRPGWFLP